MKRYKVTHRVRPIESIGSSFVDASRIIYATNKDEAINQAQREWNAAKHETAGCSAELTDSDSGDDVTTYLGIQFGPREQL